MDTVLRHLADINNVNTTIWGMPLWCAILIIIILLLFSGMYSASENAFSNCNKFHFQSLANKGKRTAKLITYLIDRFDNTLISILVGNNIIQTVMSFLSALIFYNICQLYNIGNYEAVLSTVVMGALVYIVSDTIPKVLSKAIPNKLAVILAYPVFITNCILFPIIFIFKMFLKFVYFIFNIKDTNLLTKEDLLHSVSEAINEETLLEDSEDEKLFEKSEQEIMQNVFAFDKLHVKNVYTPKEKVVSINIEGLTCEILNKNLTNITYSRIPIYEKEPDNIIGILILKIYFEEYIKDKHLNIRSILEKPLDIDINDEISDVFERMNIEKVHLGIVRKEDTYIGIIAMQDILEELITDIDETQKAGVKR